MIKIAQMILIISFLILLSGKYFNLFPDYQLIGNFSLYKVRYIIMGLYVILKIYDYSRSKN